MNLKLTEVITLILLLVLCCALLTLCSNPAYSAERDYQEEWCNKFEGQTEYRLQDKTRVDCLLSTYAIEFDFAKKWAEAVGQSLLYACRTDRRPGIVLIMRSDKDCKYLDRLREVLHYGGMGITVWETGAYAYQCEPEL